MAAALWAIVRVLVLGGGPAGATAALQARELGADVTLVEAKRVGGTSLNEGPAPVRTLARAARLVRDARGWDEFGLRGQPPQVDIAATLARAGRVAERSLEREEVRRLSPAPPATLLATNVQLVTRSVASIARFAMAPPTD